MKKIRYDWIGRSESSFVGRRCMDGINYPIPSFHPPLSAFSFGHMPTWNHPPQCHHTVSLNLITYPTETSKNGTNYLYSAVVECPFIDNISCWIFGNVSPTPPGVLRGDIDVDGEISPTGEKNRLCKPNGPLTKKNTLRSELFLLWFF